MSISEFVRQIFKATREQMTREEFAALLAEFEAMLDACDDDEEEQ